MYNVQRIINGNGNYEIPEWHVQRQSRGSRRSPLTFQLFNSSIIQPLVRNSGQALVEFILFTLVLVAASYGMLKLFIVAWTNKFDFISVIMGAVGALF